MINRLELLEKRHFIENQTAVDAVMGKAEHSSFDLENVLEHYFEMSRDILTQKAPDQIRNMHDQNMVKDRI